MNGENFGKAAASYIRDDIHWGSDLDVLKEAFEAALENEDCIEYLDVGCGPGFHIGALRAMYPDASITGVDFSAQMLRILRERVPDIETVFADIVHDAVPGTYNVVSLLNNSLGNVEYDHGFAPQLARKMTMDNIRSSLRSDGSLVLSVYNREKLSLAYGRRLRVVVERSDMHAGDLQLSYESPNGTRAEYFSHWFTEAELCSLLEGHRFKIELLEKRMSRFVTKARAV